VAAAGGARVAAVLQLRTAAQQRGEREVLVLVVLVVTHEGLDRQVFFVQAAMVTQRQLIGGRVQAVLRRRVRVTARRGALVPRAQRSARCWAGSCRTGKEHT
jgi:hypothetical protein